MSSLFWLVIGLSLAGGATCLIVFAALAPFRSRLIKSWPFYLLLIVMLRFLVPLPLNLPFSIPQLEPVTAFISAAASEAQNSPSLSPDIVTPTSSIDQANAATAITAGQSGEARSSETVSNISRVSFLGVLPVIWLIGTGGLFIWSAAGYALTVRRLKRARNILIPGRVPIYESSDISTPLAAGLFRPAIYLPKDYGFSDMAVRHELCHLRRGDIWLKWLIQLVVCIHWFNPLVYLLKRELNRLIELSCDRTIVRDLSQPERKTYSIMLLDAAQSVSNQGGMLVASLGKDKRMLQERLKEIMKNKKATKKSIATMSALVIVVLCAAMISGVLLTSCTASADTNLVKAKSYEIIANVGDNNKDSIQDALYNATEAADDIQDAINKGDKADPFVNDPDALGTWESVDAVLNIDDFDPENMLGQGCFPQVHVVFAEDGKMNFPVWSWSKGVIHMHNANVSKSYTIKEINGSKYMFFNALITNPSVRYIVLKCSSASTDIVNITDNIDLPFVDDPAVIGTWKTVDFVKNITDFNPAIRTWQGADYLKAFTFNTGGSMVISVEGHKNMVQPGITWTNGVVLNSYDITASNYEIQEINGSKYLFFEWKSGDYVFLHMEPSYYVLEKTS